MQCVSRLICLAACQTRNQQCSFACVNDIPAVYKAHCAAYLSFCHWCMNKLGSLCTIVLYTGDCTLNSKSDGSQFMTSPSRDVERTNHRRQLSADSASSLLWLANADDVHLSRFAADESHDRCYDNELLMQQSAVEADEPLLRCE